MQLRIFSVSFLMHEPCEFRDWAFQETGLRPLRGTSRTALLTYRGPCSTCCRCDLRRQPFIPPDRDCLQRRNPRIMRWRAWTGMKGNAISLLQQYTQKHYQLLSALRCYKVFRSKEWLYTILLISQFLLQSVAKNISTGI